MDSLIEKGPLTVVLVFRSTCPHCVTYKPIWEELCRTKGRKAHMVSMESDVYDKTSLAPKKEVSAVPTVLYVNAKGEITEAESPRDTEKMSDVVRMATPYPSSEKASSSSEMIPAGIMTLSASSEKASSEMRTITPSSEVQTTIPSPVSEAPSFASPVKSKSESNDLKIVPGTPIKTEPSYESEGSMLEKLEKKGDEEVALNEASFEEESEKLPQPLPGNNQQGGDLTGNNQHGGDPWSALIFAARQAAPTALLLSAYAALPARSSGLGPAKRRTRRKSKSPKVD